MFGRPGQMVGLEAIELLQIIQERLLKTRGVFPQRHFLLAYPIDDFVLDVGDVHHLLDRVAPEFEVTPHQIGKHKGAEVANMAVVINRRAATIHADLFPARVQRNKFLDGPGQRIKKLERHWYYYDINNWRGANERKAKFTYQNSLFISTVALAIGIYTKSAATYFPVPEGHLTIAQCFNIG
jgi:hypothetical protein